MTATHPANEKRMHLVEAAAALLHEQGFHRTTLADVAGRAQVPLGNVYYYFKTKEALAEAVILAHEIALRGAFATWDEEHDAPLARLRCLTRAPLDEADAIVRFGCPHGGLCQELEKLGPDAPLAQAGARLLAIHIDWAESQFRSAGAGRESRALASDLVARIQGTLLVAHTMRSHDVLAKQLRRVERWLETELSGLQPRNKK